MNPREKLKRELMAQRPHCEGWRFRGWQDERNYAEDCSDERHMNEVLFTRGHAVTAKQKAYSNDARNCALMCSAHHTALGHSKAFRTWWRDVRAVELYGSESVDAYLAGGPTKRRRA